MRRDDAEHIQWTGQDLEEIINFFFSAGCELPDFELIVKTGNETFSLDLDDVIIRGDNGEFIHMRDDVVIENDEAA